MSNQILNVNPRCPNCNAQLDGFTAVTEDVAPVDGDVSICLYCQAVNIFNADLTLRPPTEEDLLDLPLVELAEAQKTLSLFKKEK